MKVWITKYALTQGIYEVEVTPSHTPTMVCGSGPYTEYYHGEGREWHRTKEGAIVKAEAMRIAKIAALTKKLVSLEKLKFGD